MIKRILYSDVNHAYTETLADLLEVSEEIHASDSKSVGSNRKFKEILNYHFVLEYPMQRLLNSSNRSFKLPGAIARFVWMMAANNRLADIEFYWGNKITPFTDDGYTIPGSSYGARMFNSSPGLDQIEHIIKRLKQDHSTRRAAVSIYLPVDAIRESKDIPCTFGLFYHIRENKLISTVVMRSNNAFILLPYNLFEFSLLAEIIAKEVGVEMGAMHYHAMSMHVYSENYEQAQKIVGDKNSTLSYEFPAMPREPSPMEEVKKLIRLEAKVRHISAGLNSSNINEWLNNSISIGDGDNDKITLSSYWKQFYYLLLYFMVSKRQDAEALQKVASFIEEPYRSYLNQADIQAVPQGLQFDLFGNTTESTDFFAFNQYSRHLGKLEKMVKEYNNNPSIDGKLIDFGGYIALRKTLVGNIGEIKEIAARNQTPDISQEQFLNAVSGLFRS
jgi:thymidylate synthase